MTDPLESNHEHNERSSKKQKPVFFGVPVVGFFREQQQKKPIDRHYYDAVPTPAANGLLRNSFTGSSRKNVTFQLDHLSSSDDEEEPDEETVLCKNSYWIYTDTGGVVNIHPKVTEIIKKGEVIATVRNMFGDKVKEYYAPEDGIVIGKSVNPINQTGGRILHLGIIK